MKQVFATSLLLGFLGPVAGDPSCRCFPGDACWPSEADWSSFNSSVGGALIRTIPIASVCHGDAYNETACAAIQTAWSEPALQ